MEFTMEGVARSVVQNAREQAKDDILSALNRHVVLSLQVTHTGAVLDFEYLLRTMDDGLFWNAFMWEHGYDATRSLWDQTGADYLPVMREFQALVVLLLAKLVRFAAGNPDILPPHLQLSPLRIGPQVTLREVPEARHARH